MINGKELTTNHEVLMRRVWVITGTSSGLDRSLVSVALASGDYVVATARNVDSTWDFITSNDPETAARVHTTRLDVTAPFSELRAVAEGVIEKWGRVDVFVNNAGAGILGIITEEVGVEGYQRQFAVNFFGQLNVTNAFLPCMRAQKDGTIVFVGSRSLWRSHVPMMGTYAASKAALTAAAGSLAVEVAQLNIKVLNVPPGGIKTCSWSKMTLLPTTPGALLPPTTKIPNGVGPNGSFDSELSTLEMKINGPTKNDANENHIEAYTEIRERQINWMRSAICEGDPEKCARAVFDVVTGTTTSEIDRDGNRRVNNCQWPGLNLLVLGADAEQNVRDKCNTVLRHLDEWKDVVRGVQVTVDH